MRGKENISPCHHLEGDLDEPPEPIHQEDGYMSPPPSYFRLATPDLSSPIGHSFRVSPRGHESTDDFGADIISSPLATKRRSPWFPKRSMSPHEAGNLGNILVRGTPPPVEADISGPDLRDILSICSTDDIEELEGHETSGTTSPSHRPGSVSVNTTISEDCGVDTCARAARMHTVANGWWNKWAMKQEPHPAHVSNLVVCLSKTLTLGRNYLSLDVLKQLSLLMADNRDNGLGRGLRHRIPRNVLTYFTRL